MLYVAQLVKPSREVVAKVNHEMVRAWPGPFNRVTPEVLQHLKDFGFGSEFKDLERSTQAAQFRVMHRDSAAAGGLRIESRRRALRRLADTRLGRQR